MCEGVTAHYRDDAGVLDEAGSVQCQGGDQEIGHQLGNIPHRDSRLQT